MAEEAPVRVTRTALRGALAALLLVGTGVALDRWAGPAGPYLVPMLLVAVVGGPVVAVDMAEHRIPTRLVAILASLLSAWAAWHALTSDAWWPVGRGLLAGLLVAGLFWVKWFLGGTGRGDLRLAAVLAAAAGWLGWAPAAGTVVIPYVLLFPAAVWLWVRGRRHERVPFGPSLVVGWFVAVGLHLWAG